MAEAALVALWTEDTLDSSKCINLCELELNLVMFDVTKARAYGRKEEKKQLTVRVIHHDNKITIILHIYPNASINGLTHKENVFSWRRVGLFCSQISSSNYEEL